MALHLGSDCPVILSTGSTGVEHRQPSHEWKVSIIPLETNRIQPLKVNQSASKSSELQNLIACIPHETAFFPGEHWLVGEFFHHRALHCPWFRDPVDDVSPHLAQELRLDVWAMTSPQGVEQKVAARFLVLEYERSIGVSQSNWQWSLWRLIRDPTTNEEIVPLTLGDFLGFSHKKSTGESPFGNVWHPKALINASVYALEDLAGLCSTKLLETS